MFLLSVEKVFEYERVPYIELTEVITQKKNKSPIRQNNGCPNLILKR